MKNAIVIAATLCLLAGLVIGTIIGYFICKADINALFKKITDKTCQSDEYDEMFDELDEMLENERKTN